MSNKSIKSPVPSKSSIWVDLDGTLIWAWSPLITSEFMARVFNAQIDTPPTVKAGYRRFTKVPIGKKYALACSRPNIRPFLDALRRIGEVRMLTHAKIDYALAMNRVFKLGFTKDQMFSVTDNILPTAQPPVVLIDDESQGTYYDRHANNRHFDKCRCLGIEFESSWDIAVPPFGGMRNDQFSQQRYWRRFVKFIAHAVNKPATMPLPPKEDPIPPYTIADFDAEDSQARVEQLCGFCLSTSETANRLGVTKNTVAHLYYCDALISFPSLKETDQRRFPVWQFTMTSGPNAARPWVQPLIAAFGQNGWALVEFLTRLRPPGKSYIFRLLHDGNAAVKQVIAAARRIKAARERTSALNSAPLNWPKGHCRSTDKNH